MAKILVVEDEPHMQVGLKDNLEFESFEVTVAGDGEEGPPRFAGDGPRQQRLTSARRADKQSPFGNLATQPREALRITQKFNNFLKLFFGFVDTRDIVKGHAAMLFRQQFGFGFAKAHCAAFTAALHPVHEVNPDADQQKEGKQAKQEGLETRLLLLFGPDRNVVGDQKIGDGRIFRFDRDIVLTVGAAEPNLLAIQSDRADSIAFNSGNEIRIADLTALKRVSTARENVEQRKDQQE